jgi:hypothetical protein
LVVPPKTVNCNIIHGYDNDLLKKLIFHSSPGILVEQASTPIHKIYKIIEARMELERITGVHVLMWDPHTILVTLAKSKTISLPRVSRGRTFKLNFTPSTTRP